jgi:hypothetical protein
MQAPVWKRTNPSQVIGLALALGLAASIALNVVMLTRSDDNQAAGVSTQTSVDLLARQERYYSAKEARQDAVEAAAGARIARSGVLTRSELNYSNVKADQLNGVTAASSTTLNPALQNYYDRKSDEMGGIVAQRNTTLIPSQQLYVALKANQLNGTIAQSSAALSDSQQRYVDLKSVQMDGIAVHADATTIRAASQQRYVDLKSDQMDGIAPGQ